MCWKPAMIREGELSRNIVIPNGFLEADPAIFRGNPNVYGELKCPDPDPERVRKCDLRKEPAYPPRNPPEGLESVPRPD